MHVYVCDFRYHFRVCRHSNCLQSDLFWSWTFTRIPSKQTLDYIFTPQLPAKNDKIPGSFDCKVIHPELEKDNNEFIVKNVDSLTYYSFISSWNELSDHYPVFMQFGPLRVPGGNVHNKRKELGVVQEWPRS